MGVSPREIAWLCTSLQWIASSKQVALLILRVLYEDAAVFLDRKFEAAKRIIQLT
jgi:hypothetical protein